MSRGWGWGAGMCLDAGMCLSLPVAGRGSSDRVYAQRRTLTCLSCAVDVRTFGPEWARFPERLAELSTFQTPKGEEP